MSPRPPPYSALPTSNNTSSYNTCHGNERTPLVVYRPYYEDKLKGPSWKVIFLVAVVLLCITQIVINKDTIWKPETEAERKQRLEREEREERQWHERKERMEKERRERQEREEKERRQRQEREERERYEREEREERNRVENQGSYWEGPYPERCVAYGVREYKGYLKNLPYWSDHMKSCHYSSIKIHDREILSPNSCGEERGDVIGYWKVDFEEFECQPFWGKFYKLDCSYPNSGKRRVESRIWGLIRGHDWHGICRTTPAVIDGVYFPQPITCRDENRRRNGFIGVWEIDDGSCY